MLLDLWSLVVIISDLVVEFSLPLSGHLIAFLLIGGVIIYFAWRSTDIPDLPSPPRQPYVIQIHASINTGGTANGVTGRQNLSDVRLLNSGPVLDSVLRGLPNRHHQTQHHQHHHSRHGALFLGLLRRPQSRPLLPLPIPPTIRSRFQAPNLIVYHQVNVYHHTHGAPPPSSSARNTNSAIPSASSSTVNPQQQNVTTTNSETLNVSSSNVVSSSSSSTQNNNISQASSLNSTRRSLSENNIADIEVESEESTVDVVQVEVDDLSVSTDTTSQVGVDVNLNGGSGVTIVGQNLSSSSTTASVQLLDGLNLNVNSNLVTMNSNSNSHNTATSSHNTSSSSSVKDNKTAQDNDNTGTSSATSNDSVNATTSEGDGDVRVTLKFLNDTQIEVTSQLSEKILDFKRRHFAVELNANKIVRLIFNGRVLDNDGRTLQESGIFDQCVVHCLIVTPQTPQQRGQATASGGAPSSQIGRNLREGPEPGMFFVSVLGIILIFLWFVCYQFGHQLFTQGAVVSLVVLTAIFGFFFLRISS